MMGNKKILFSILLVLSFKICVADQLEYLTMSQTKEAQDYLKTTNGKVLNYECDPCTEPIQLVYNIRINQIHENIQTTKFIITEATTNGVDTTPTLLEAKAYLVFYTVENDNLLYMSHVWPKHNSQSYGPMYSLESDTKKETYEEYKADVYKFDWLYITGYADKKGAAKVQLIKVYKPQAITYVLKIIPSTSEVIIYKGYLEGSLNFSVFE